jgi:predicted signal transduction protein with EAL and GGDEF domain
LAPNPAQLLLVRVDDYRTAVAASGHEAGDGLLVEVADRLSTVLDAADLLAHLEPDEFAVLVAGSVPARATLDALHEAFASPHDLGDHAPISLSIGLAHGEASGELLRRAELALARASGGRGRVEVFDPRIEQELRSSLSLREDLERALHAGEFRLRYQPQVDLRSGTITGVEALVRWEHPSRGLVRPDEFIPLAEKTGLILPLGRWVLREACRQLRDWREAGLPQVRMAVNLSAGQLEQRLVADVATALRETGVDPELLELELTETVAVRDDSASLAVLNALRDLGVTLSVDDFGTGYSMLGQLRPSRSPSSRSTSPSSRSWTRTVRLRWWWR